MRALRVRSAVFGLSVIACVVPRIAGFGLEAGYSSKLSRGADHSMNALAKSGSMRSVFQKMDTRGAAGLDLFCERRHPRRSETMMSAAVLGISGHCGLLIVSIILANIIKSLPFSKAGSDAPVPQQAGLMDRCPWPFIFFHDPKQGLKDSPTLVVVLWAVLWKIWKVRKAVPTV